MGRRVGMYTVEKGRGKGEGGKTKKILDLDDFVNNFKPNSK